MKTFTKKFITCCTSVAFTLSSILPMTAKAQLVPATCYPDSATMQGRTPGCTGVTKNGVDFAFPTLQWETLASLDNGGTLSSPGDHLGTLGSARDTIGSTVGARLGVDDKLLAQAMTVGASNVPIVVARYSLWDASLAIDAYKVEKTLTGSRLLHATFAPEHGDYWKAFGAYGTSASRAAGGLGQNPFEAFKGGTGLFEGISQNAAMVAVGHAQRFVQAPVAILAVVQSNVRTTQTKKKSAWGLRKTVTTHYWMDMNTKWYMSMPASEARTSAVTVPAGYCVNAPNVTNASCSEGEQLVSAGVGFMEMTGGTFHSDQVTEGLGSRSQSGWTGLAVVALVLATGGAGVGLGAVALGTAATVVNTSFLGAYGGIMGYQLADAFGLVGGGGSSGTSISAPSAGVTQTTGISLGGSRLGRASSSTTFVQTSAATQAKASSGDSYIQIGIGKSRSEVTQSLGGAIAPVQNTVTGGCSLAAQSGQCGAAGLGLVQRADQAVTTKQLQLYRDASGGTLTVN